MSKRDVILGVIFGIAGLWITMILPSAISDAAKGASDDADPTRSLMVLLGLGFAVLALANSVAMRARARRRQFEERD